MQAVIEESNEREIAQDLIAKAQAAVREFYSSCFWFRHPDAVVSNRADVRNVIRHLREYGGRKAWHVAQDLQKCL